MKKRPACVCKATMNVPNERSIFILIRKPNGSRRELGVRSESFTFVSMSK